MIYGFVILASLLVVAAGFLSMIVPLKFLGIKTRKAGALVLVAGVVLSLLGGMKLGAEQDKEAVAAGFASRKDQREAERRGLASQADLAAARAKEMAEAQVVARKAREAAAARAGFANVAAYDAAQAAGLSTKAEYDRHLAVEAFFAVPPDERAFIASVEAARVAFRAAANDLAKGGTRNARKAAICAALKSRTVARWVGRISDLSSNSDGKGVLSVTIGENIAVGTWNNAISDIGFRTLIDPASAIFQQLATMKEGDRVRFSGQFDKDSVDCVREQSLTLSGSMTDPEFVFRFHAIETP